MDHPVDETRDPFARLIEQVACLERLPEVVDDFGDGRVIRRAAASSAARSSQNQLKQGVEEGLSHRDVSLTELEDLVREPEQIDL